MDEFIERCYKTLKVIKELCNGKPDYIWDTGFKKVEEILGFSEDEMHEIWGYLEYHEFISCYVFGQVGITEEGLDLIDDLENEQPEPDKEKNWISRFWDRIKITPEFYGVGVKIKE